MILLSSPGFAFRWSLIAGAPLEWDGGPQQFKETVSPPLSCCARSDNKWLVARHEDGTISTNDERRRRAVTRAAGCDVHDITDASCPGNAVHETRRIDRIGFVIVVPGTVAEGQMVCAVNAAPRVHAAVGRATDGVRGAAGHGDDPLVARATAPEHVGLV